MHNKCTEVIGDSGWSCSLSAKRESSCRMFLDAHAVASASGSWSSKRCARLVAERHVHRHDVGGGDDLVQPRKPGAQVALHVLRQALVVKVFDAAQVEALPRVAQGMRRQRHSSSNDARFSLMHMPLTNFQFFMFSPYLTSRSLLQHGVSAI